MWGFSSAGRAPALHAGGQEFESPNLHHLKQMELLKSAPSGAFLVCLNPIKHNKHSELVDTILTMSCIRDFEKKYRKFDILVGSFYKKFSLII